MLETENIQNRSTPDILTFKEVMELLHVRKTTMYKLLQQHDPPPFTKMGRNRIITREGLLSWIREHEGDIIY